MRRLLLTTLAAAILPCTAGAQSPSTPPPPAPTPATNPTVILDVSVTGQDNHPVPNLKSSDFLLTDSNAPQTVQTFAEHSSSTPPPAAPTLPPLPPGTFTNYTPLPPNAPLIILLIDALNTPTKDSAFIRYQLQQYVNQANPGAHIAIFGLANRLILLQGFTSDPSILRAAVEHKLIPRSPILLDRTNTPAQPSPSNAAYSPSPTDLAANLREFEADTGSLETGFRTQFTLDALNTLAHYLAALPGRKNLIWLSGSIPFSTLPEPPQPKDTPPDPSTNNELQQTVDLLSKARVSIDPIDATVLLAQPAPTAANPSHPTHFTDDAKKFHETPTTERATMQQLAASTGGQAILHPTSLASAVAQAIAAAANFYTLTYTPTQPSPPGAYRPIQLSLTASSTALNLAYRRGYYAPTPPDAGLIRAYGNAAMSRGAPTPEDLLFKVRVLPASTALETSVAAGNQLDPDVSPKGPFRRYDVDFVALPAELTFTPHPDGSHSAAVEFLVYVFDTDGRVLNTIGKSVTFTATAANFNKLLHSAMACHAEISVPDRQETFLRLGVRDVPSNKFGVLELPTADVSHLPIATYTPRRTPSVPPSPSPAPPTGRPLPPQD